MHRPNRTPLERINDEIECGIAKNFPRSLLDMELERHTRKGQRDCDCEYCEAKRRATRNVAHALGNVIFGPVKDRSDVICHGSCGNERYTEHWVLALNARERVRKDARAELKAIKERTD